MKKLVSLIGVVILLFSMSITVLGGSVPEDLLRTDTAKVFLATVENYTTKDIPSSPYTIIDTVEFIPTEKIKGDVEVGVKQSYSKCRSSLELKSNIEYLIGYVDDNNLYICEIEKREGNQFKLVGSDIHDMTKRFEDYLNDGSFEKAEKERVAKSEQSSTSVIGGADEPTDIVVKSNINVWGIFGIGIGVLFIILVICLIIKKRNK